MIILVFKLVVPILLGLLQTIQVNKLVQPNHVTFSDNHPNLHTANHYPSQVWHKLPWSDVEVVQEFHDEWMDGESKVTLESSLIEAHFPKQESTSFFPFTKKLNPDLLKESKPISKPKKDISSIAHSSLKAWKGLISLHPDDEGPNVAISPSASTGSSLDDNLISSSLDLTSNTTSLSPTISLN